MSDIIVYEDESRKIIHDVESSLESLAYFNNAKDKRINELLFEVKSLKEEYSKDAEIKKMQEKLDKMVEDYNRGFPITKEQQQSINDWIKKHEKQKHGLIAEEKRLESQGCGGGKYMYEFIPTSIGTIGTIKCDCGDDFTFCDL